MKRYDPSVEQLIAELPETSADLRYVSVVVYDPEFEPYFEPGDIVRGSDVPRQLIDATRRGEAEQVEEAVGAGTEDVVRAFSESFLGSMLHDLNVVHGALERMGEPLPSRVVAGDWWNEGSSVTGSLRLQNGARCDLAWIQVLGTFEYRETIQFVFAHSVRTLEFPSPWLKQHPTIYRRTGESGRMNVVRIAHSYDESFAASCVISTTASSTGRPAGHRRKAAASTSTC